MKLGEFIDKYCQDIVLRKRKEELLTLYDGLAFDRIIEDESGRLIKVIDVDGFDPIPVEDIVSMVEPEFIQRYPAPAQQEAYRAYCYNIIMLEGEEALNHIRNSLLREWKDIEDYSNAQGGLDF